MIHLELTKPAAEVLRDTLEWYLSELRVEIAGTDRKAFRDTLKANKRLLIGIADQLGEQLLERAAELALGAEHH